MAWKMLYYPNMRHFKPLLLCALCVGVAFASHFPTAQAQLPAASLDAQPTAEALKTVLAQQKTLTDNQGKIDDKLAVIAENLRIARIYGSRIK